MRRLALYCLLLLWPGVAHAEWLQASSSHFVIYADDSEKDIRRFSDQLERYHSAMEKLTGHELQASSPSNRVSVYVVKSEREVRALYGQGSRYLSGFYIPRAGASLAIVPRVDAGRGEIDPAMLVLLHEYSHHFFISGSSFPMPRWLSEGAAEFFSSASFEEDGGISLGRPAKHRALELFYAKDVKIADLLDPGSYEKRKNTGYDAYYGKSWLLYHFLTFDPRRKGQLARYVGLMTRGKSSRDAALEAFGEFATLERELDAYMLQRRLLSYKLSPAALRTGPVDVRRLSAGEAAMMPVLTRSRRGVTAEQARALLVEARAIAARFPGDAGVLSALAEAEHDAGNDNEAIAAADAALALDPTQVNAYVQKGLALFRMAAAADDRAKAFDRARAPFIALNKREPNHPLPLIYYYRSFVEQGRDPPQLALDGLAFAVELAPFDLGLRMTLAGQQLRSGQREDARRTLAPIAYNPHGGGMATVAQRLLAKLDSDASWNGSDGLGELMAGAEDDQESTGG